MTASLFVDENASDTEQAFALRTEVKLQS